VKKVSAAAARRSAAERARRWRADLTSAPRLVLAAKTAAAAALAWYLAPLVPFADAEYSYYAPLGVLLSMYPTLADSARSGLQVIAGLTIGIGLGLLGLSIVIAGVPGVIAVAAVIALGVWLGGLHALGAGRELVAVAGLFVLLLGGRHADEFSMSYLVTMAFGVLVGVVVNLLVFPPIYLRRASERLSELRDVVADRLDRLAEAVEAEAFDADAVERDMEELTETVTSVSADVHEAAASRRGNPRGRRRAGEASENAARLRALERTVFFTRDLADVLARDPALAADPGGADPGGRRTGGADTGAAAARDRLAHAIRACGALVATPVDATDTAGPNLRAATEAIEELVSAIDETAAAHPSGIAQELTAAVCLRRIVDASRPFVRAEGA